ncbi:MAG: SpoIIE family protein phosphatase [Acidobacteriota bacterium]
MGLQRRARRAALTVAAVVFAAAAILYGLLWMVDAHRVPAVELGFEDTYADAERVVVVTLVHEGSPAEASGMLPGDRIFAINGRRIEDESSLRKVWMRHEPGDTVELTVERKGQSSPVLLTAVFRARLAGRLAEHFAEEVRDMYPVPFLIVGLTVLFLRLEDRNAWLLALLFASFTAAPDYSNEWEALVPALRPFTMAYRALFLSVLGALFYNFFAVFPARSPIDRRLPWLRWAAVVIGLSLGLPGLRSGQMQLPPPLPALLGENARERVALCYTIGFAILGLASIAVNYLRTQEPEALRKIRVIFWGTAAGVTPALAQAAAETLFRVEVPNWLRTVVVALLFLLPVSFAYAVVKHRVLEIPVLLKRSARYLLVQRGFTILLSLLSIGFTLLFAFSYAHYLRPIIEFAQPSGIAIGAAFGTVLFWGGSHIHRRVSGEIDRAFFRGAYDARMILEDLAERTPTAKDIGALADMLDRHLREALHPSSLAIYFRSSPDLLRGVSGGVPPDLSAISTNLPALAEMAKRGQPLELTPSAYDASDGTSALAQLKPDCLVPIMGRNRQLAGLIVLGQRLSEEPYSGEDRRLLASVASQAGSALDNIRLAEEIAERMENERRAAREMEIARQVQTRLLPQAPPPLKTLECAAQCIQARSVGGDYYDFLDLGPGHAGFVLADVSGKGVHAALLMANLQAHLRSQSAIAPLDPVSVLTKVNRMLYGSTAGQHFATLFYGVYDDATCTLLYANCGHNPPVLLRSDGTVARLAGTATIVGIFDEWECAVESIQLASGDLLAVYSDGVTEATRDEEEFGEERLIDALLAHRDRPVSDITTAVLAGVQQFSAGTQSDDLTLLVARVTRPAGGTDA